MIRSLYTSGWSMMADSKRMDVISNNLANVDTNGYKKDLAVSESFEAVLTKRIDDSYSILNPSGTIGTMKLGRDNSEIFTYFNQGNIVSTGEKLNLAINNSANSFFTIGIMDANGNVTERYSRDGVFVIDGNNRLSNSKGSFLMGEDGPIQVNSSNIVVEKDGSVYENDIYIDRIKMVTFENTDNLRKIGNSLITENGQTAQMQFDGEIIQGAVEKSNVNAIDEMVEMINVLRSYEANQKLVQYEDNTLQKAVNEIGLLR